MDLTASKGTHGDRLRGLYNRGRIAAWSGDPITMIRTPPNNNNNNTNEEVRKETKVDQGKNIEKGHKEVTSFPGDHKILRTPILSGSNITPFAASTGNPKKQLNSVVSFQEEIGLATTTITTHQSSLSQQIQQSTDIYSPRQEQIKKMRLLEEECLMKCRTILKKMKQAMDRQKNISKDVKDGVSQLDEQIDVISRYRRIWKEAESNRNAEATRISETQTASHRSVEDETPVTTRNKRAATSPASPGTNKKVKENTKGEWQIVKNQKKQNKKEIEVPASAARVNGKRVNGNREKRNRKDDKKRPSAVLVKPTAGTSYADVLSKIKHTVNSFNVEEPEIPIRSVRKTQKGAIRLEVAKGGNKEKLCEAIKISLRDTADVSNLKMKTTIEIRDLDTLTEVHEISAAIRNLLDGREEELNIRLTNANSREQRRAFVTLETGAAATVTRNQRIKVGWIYCRVRHVADVQRCFRCFGTGHTQRKCSGPDRKGEGLCIRCGIAGHKMKECTSQPRCCICTTEGKRSVDHIPGTSRCSAYNRVNPK